MKKKTKRPLATGPQDCERTRLAQSSAFAVDLCSCGVMQLHIGALTLRLPPDAMSELLMMLGEAVAVHQAQSQPDDASENATVTQFLSAIRGEA